jgi:hypothetical protein
MRQESLSFCSPREMIFIPEFWKTKKNMSLGGCSVGSKMVVMEGLPFVQAFPVFFETGFSSCHVGNGQHSHPQVIDVFRSQTSSLPYVIM